jgi:hypothetical protein
MRPKTSPAVRAQRAVSNEEFLAAKRSMMGSAPLPTGYGRIETTQEAVAAAVPPARDITIRLTIVWDNDIRSMDLGHVLDTMRATGAAFVLSAEQVAD